MNDRPARDWWELVEEHLARGDHAVEGADDAHDPWSEGGVAPALTDAQRELLGGVEDQPGVPRVTHRDDQHDDQPPVPRFAHHVDPDDDVPDDDVPDATTGNMPGDTP
jgi:hypothetical protein